MASAVILASGLILTWAVAAGGIWLLLRLRRQHRAEVARDADWDREIFPPPVSDTG